MLKSNFVRFVIASSVAGACLTTGIFFLKTAVHEIEVLGR